METKEKEPQTNCQGAWVRSPSLATSLADGFVAFLCCFNCKEEGCTGLGVLHTLPCEIPGTQEKVTESPDKAWVLSSSCSELKRLPSARKKAKKVMKRGTEIERVTEQEVSSQTLGVWKGSLLGGGV